jgi:hypothetical protein
LEFILSEVEISKEKESRKKEITYPLANLVAILRGFLLND